MEVFEQAMKILCLFSVKACRRGPNCQVPVEGPDRRTTLGLR